jgi:primosomal protein N'
MKILTVIPIGKGIPRDELSYFSAREVPFGTLVTVPFGGRKIKGVVADARDVRDLKSSIKQESYALKNISEIHTDTKLPYGVFEAAQTTARFFSQRIGAVLETVLPKVLFEYYLGNAGNRGHGNRIGEKKSASDVAAMQIPFAERILAYKTMIRENLAQGKSTMIVCSTISETERFCHFLKTGIEDRIIALHSKKTKLHFKKSFARILNDANPCIVIATPPFASLERNDWREIIIERASANSYRYEFGPVFDLRYFVEHQARACGARLVFADTLLPTEIRFRISTKEIYELRATWHIARPEHFQIADQKPKELDPTPKQVARDFSDTKKPFRSLSDEAMRMISSAEAGSRTLLVASRKGLAPLTVCSDCGTIVSCPNCETPLVLHRTKPKSNESGASGRTYLCHHCGFQTPPTDFCAHCFGSRLATIGISTERIRDDILEKIPEARISILEREGDESISKTLASWNEQGGILITTPSLLSAIDSAEFGCVVSLDALLSLPTYTSGETSLATLLQFLEKIKTEAIIQTRNADHSVIRTIASENLFEFMQEELALRKQFNYPPSKVLVKISVEVSSMQTQDAARSFETMFQPYDPDVMIKRSKKLNFITITAILKIDLTLWNDFSSPLHELLDSLSPQIKKEINPDSVI